ncbi:hypothetical protein D3C81_1619090 [compost metagenome]
MIHLIQQAGNFDVVALIGQVLLSGTRQATDGRAVQEIFIQRNLRVARAFGVKHKLRRPNNILVVQTGKKG